MWELKSEGAIYKVDKLSGQGKTARVFRAIRQDSKGHSRQIVALKILKNESAIPWLRREFETLARVDSPYCVRVLSWENLSEGSALVLEWVEGITLFDLARDWMLDSDLIDEVIAQVQEGLRALDRCGLHHGDLSPVNILIDTAGTVRIVDFGAIPPESGVVHGTPQYVAPEIWAGDKPNLQSDLFALGLIEHDLRTSFERWRIQSDVDESTVEMRDQILALAQSLNSPLTCLEPQARCMRDLVPRQELQKRLALGVKKVMEFRRSGLIETQMQRRKVDISYLVRRASAAVFILMTIAVTAAAPVRAQAPLEPTVPLELACLRVRSLHWIGVSLDGHDLGYAPILLKNLTPGRHELEWRTQFSTGRMSIFLKPGRCLQLSDPDFNLSPQSRTQRKH